MLRYRASRHTELLGYGRGVVLRAVRDMLQKVDVKMAQGGFSPEAAGRSVNLVKGCDELQERVAYLANANASGAGVVTCCHVLHGNPRSHGLHVYV